MESKFSHIVDVLHAVSSEKRLKEFCRLLSEEPKLHSSLLAGSKFFKPNISCQPSPGDHLLGNQHQQLRNQPSDDQSIENQPTRDQTPNHQPREDQPRGDQLIWNQPLLNHQPLGDKSPEDKSIRKHRQRFTISLLNLEEDSSTWKPNADMIDSWSKDTSMFWISSTRATTFDGQLASIYDSTLALERCQAVDVLRLRFLYIFFYDLLVLLYPQQHKNALKTTYTQIAKLIFKSRPSNHPIEDISSRIQDWVSRGRRYHKLSETFNNGILFELPTNVCRYSVEKRLPLQDETAYDNAICDIVKLKLKEKAVQNGSNALANKIRQSSLRPFLFLGEDPLMNSSTLGDEVGLSRTTKRRRLDLSSVDSSEMDSIACNDTTRFQDLLAAAEFCESGITPTTLPSIHHTASNETRRWPAPNVEGTQTSVWGLNVEPFLQGGDFTVWDLNVEPFLQGDGFAVWDSNVDYYLH